MKIVLLLLVAAVYVIVSRMVRKRRREALLARRSSADRGVVIDGVFVSHDAGRASAAPDAHGGHRR